MDSTKASILGSLLLTLVSGCYSYRYSVVETPSAPLSQYQILEVADFRNHLPRRRTQKIAEELPERITQQLSVYNKRHRGAPLFKQVTRTAWAAKTGERVLLLRGTLVAYEKGNRAKRFFLLGLGGKAYCTVQMDLVDKRTGRSVMKLQLEGELANGWIGGNARKSAHAVIKAAVQYFINEARNRP